METLNKFNEVSGANLTPRNLGDWMEGGAGYDHATAEIEKQFPQLKGSIDKYAELKALLFTA